MELKVWKCDKCGKEYRDNSGATISFAVDTEMDGAGDRDTIHKHADLCSPCQKRLIDEMLSSLSYGAQAVLAKTWGAR